MAEEETARKRREVEEAERKRREAERVDGDRDDHEHADGDRDDHEHADGDRDDPEGIALKGLPPALGRQPQQRPPQRPPRHTQEPSPETMRGLKYLSVAITKSPWSKPRGGTSGLTPPQTKAKHI